MTTLHNQFFLVFTHMTSK